MFWSDEVGIAIDDVNGFLVALESERVKVLDAGKFLGNGKGMTDVNYSKDFLHLNEDGYVALNRELVEILR